MTADLFPDDPRTMRERMLAGDLYIGGDPELEALGRRAVELQDAYHRASVAGEPDARRHLEALLGSLGEGAYVKPPLLVDYGAHLHIGARTFVNDNLMALDVVEIRIGEDCMIGPNVQLLTPTHPVDPEPRRAKREAARPITIGDDVWIGGRAILYPGVTVGDDSVVGAGAVVTRDVPPGVVVVGNPARVLRSVR